MGEISNCRRMCSHYFICKYREQFEQQINKKIELENIPDFMITDVSFLCKKQDREEPNNIKFIEFYHSCEECKHKEVCENKEGYEKIENELKDNETIFELRCPYFTRIEVKG